MKSQGIKNEKKRKRDVDGSIGDGMSDISELKRLKLSVGLSNEQTIHHTRDTVNEKSWSHPDSPEPILCDPVSPPAVPLDEDLEFSGYLRFNEFLGRIHQESRIHRGRISRHSPEHGSSNGHSPV